MMRVFLVVALTFTIFVGARVYAQNENVTATAAATSPPASPPTSPPATVKKGGSSVVTLSATVKGNQEQPKVLYIVPWQVAQDHQILYRPLNSQTNRVFDHVERSEHKRELEFISNLGEEPKK